MARTKGAVGKGVDNKDVRDYLLAHGPLSHLNRPGNPGD